MKHEVTYDPSSRRAECSCGRWRAYGVSASGFATASRAHVASEARRAALADLRAADALLAAERSVVASAEAIVNKARFAEDMRQISAPFKWGSFGRGLFGGTLDDDEDED